MKQKTQSEVTVNESKHTPGPWVLGKPYKDSTNNTIYEVDVKLEPCEKCGSNGTYLIARTFKNAIGKGQAEANARLIAAAPDMLEALITITNELGEWLDASDDQFGREQNEAYQKAVEAIAKATNSK